MITYVRGNIFDSDAEALVNPVNCVGVMGAGLAKAFAIRYPDMEKLYKEACRAKEIKIGTILIYSLNNEARKKILLFPTKIHWKDPSKLEYIDAGLKRLRAYIFITRTDSLAIPHIGCGKGKLPWKEVKPLIEKHLGNIDFCKVTVYEPG